MNSPCYRCHLRSVRCHAECEAYAEWKRDLEDARASETFPTTAAHERKITNAVKDRMDGRGRHKTGE